MGAEDETVVVADDWLVSPCVSLPLTVSVNWPAVRGVTVRVRVAEACGPSVPILH